MEDAKIHNNPNARIAINAVVQHSSATKMDNASPDQITVMIIQTETDKTIITIKHQMDEEALEI